MKFYILIQQPCRKGNGKNAFDHIYNMESLILNSVKKDRHSGKHICLSYIPISPVYQFSAHIAMNISAGVRIYVVNTTELSYTRLRKKWEGFWPDPVKLRKYKCKKQSSINRVIVSFLSEHEILNYYNNRRNRLFKCTTAERKSEGIYTYTLVETKHLISVIIASYCDYRPKRNHFNIENDKENTIGLLEMMVDNRGIIYPQNYKHHNLIEETRAN